MGKFQQWLDSLPPARGAPAWLVELESRNGFERERAVRDVQARGDVSALPFLLERANDWVWQVRQAAKHALLALLKDEHLDAWQQALPAVDALRRGGREDHGELLASIHQFLMRPANLQRLAAHRESLPHVARRMVFDLQLKQAAEPDRLFRLLVEGAASSDLVLASQALAAAPRLIEQPQRQSVLGTACGNSHAPIRLAALRLLAIDVDDGARSLLRLMCWDHNAAVRSLALQLAVADRGLVIDEALLLLHEVQASPRTQASALLVLCAVGHPNALPACERLADAPVALLRRVAIAGLWRLGPEVGRPHLLMRALADASPKVQQLAVLWVRRGAPAPPIDELQALAERDDVLKAVLAVLGSTPPWDRLALVLRGLASSDASSTRLESLKVHLTGWCADMHRCFVSPTLTQKATVAELWRMPSLTLPEALRKAVRFHLESFGVV